MISEKNQGIEEEITEEIKQFYEKLKSTPKRGGWSEELNAEKFEQWKESKDKRVI